MESKKGWIEIILMPLVVVIMGAFCTYFISRSQTNMSRELEIINKKIKILDIASRYMTDENESKRIFSVKLLKIVDPDIAGELLKIIEENTEESLRVRSVAQEVGNTVEQKGQNSDDSDLKEKGAIGDIKFLNQDNLFTIKWLSYYKKGGIVF